MDKKRASEITSSPEMVEVTYNNKPVYIEAVHQAKDTASVHYLDQPAFTQEVALTQLVEAK
ncbi:MAG: small acid-soluble spore family protein [Anaerocolumna sp.]|jgi:small acid-soluble spore protein H (minor)|nr:small acid-soluble spore family protein [Anaerocolumna sp.]